MATNIDELTYSLLKSSLNAAAERSRVIANNIANVNTKGYKAYKLNFEDNLNEVLQNEDVSLTTTNSAHIKDESAEAGYTIERDNSTSMNMDGNNVDIDLEMSNMSANTILYETLISQANSMISARRYIISGGTK